MDDDIPPEFYSTDPPTVWLPTPEQIAAGCEEIQSEWTPAERKRRQVTRRRAVTVRVCGSEFMEPEGDE